MPFWKNILELKRATGLYLTFQTSESPHRIVPVDILTTHLSNSGETRAFLEALADSCDAGGVTLDLTGSMTDPPKGVTQEVRSLLPILMTPVEELNPATRQIVKFLMVRVLVNLSIEFEKFPAQPDTTVRFVLKHDRFWEDRVRGIALTQEA